MNRRWRPHWDRWLARRIPASGSVRLTQRRIFIVPSRVGGAFMIALGLMLLAGINYQNSLAYGLTFLLASVFVVAILHTYRNLAGLILKAGGTTPVFVGEAGRWRVRLESSGRAHQAIALGWPPADLQAVDIAEYGSVTCELNAPTTRRGWLRPGRLRVESRFPLGVLVAWSWVDLDQPLLVYPRPLPGELPLHAGADQQSPEQGRLAHGQGADDFQGLKAYQPGDSRRRLDSKAYSRGQGLQVKDFASYSGLELDLDFDALDGDIETRLSRLCHWVLMLSERQQSFALRLPGLYRTAASGDAHRDACLQALALYGNTP